MITKSKVYYNRFIIKFDKTPETRTSSTSLKEWKDSPIEINTSTFPAGSAYDFAIKDIDYDEKIMTICPTVNSKYDTNNGGTYSESSFAKDFNTIITNRHLSELKSVPSGRVYEYIIIAYNPIDNGEYNSAFGDAIFDTRENTKSIHLDEDILMFINEYAIVLRDGNEVRLNIQPIMYEEYSRLMSRPYKRPTKNQAWRFIDNSNNLKKSEIVVGPHDILRAYGIRYLKRPRAIRLTDFGAESGVTIDGNYTEQSCELDPILHPEIIQRGVELAYAAYRGSLQDQLALGNQSQTNLGLVASGGGGNRQQQQ